MNFFELSEAAVQFTEIETVRQRPANGWHWSGYETAPRPANGLIFVCDNITLHYRQKKQPDFALHRGEVAFAPAGCRYAVFATGAPQRRVSVYTVNFKILSALGQPLTPENSLGVLAVDRLNRFFGYAEELAAACNDVKENRLLKTAALCRYLNAVITEAAPTANLYYPIRHGVELLKAEWNQNQKIARYAAVCGVSESYFHRVFKNYSGVSPLAYRNLLRVSNAKAMLRDGSMSVAEIARLTGFEDPFYFSRVFKVVTGTSPQRFKIQGLPEK